ncbi:DUF607-domain-containing protein [Ramaria rubella]|nr:DUF607-domain-containing protein [Ramaria rubella]
MATVSKPEDESIKVGHSRFISEASVKDKWKDGVGNPCKGGEEATGDELEGMAEGKVLPTSSHLLKLILPLNPPISSSLRPPPTVFLLHPSQPLSHLARLIGSSLGSNISTISFRSVSPDELRHDEVEWSDSTDIGDFVKSAVTEEHFTIVLTPKGDDRVITVRVPSFKDRTQFLRRRLRAIDVDLRQMEQLKRQCDMEAHRGARRMALGGFGMLLVYWLSIARLTFFDYGWDVMEPITYLSGLSTVICGYLWFLYKGRELSYSSVLNQSVSARRDALYKSRGLDIEHWIDLITEQKALRREMNKIAQDYDVRWEDREAAKNKLREGGDGANDSAEEAKV